jgi:hypothetical protein
VNELYGILENHGEKLYRVESRSLHGQLVVGLRGLQVGMQRAAAELNSFLTGGDA